MAIGFGFVGHAAFGGTPQLGSKVGEGIVYERTNKADPAEKPYVGRAKNEDRYAERQQEHARDNPKADYDFKVVERADPGQPLREAEQRQITARGGPTNKKNPNGGTSNKRNEIAPPKSSKSICSIGSSCQSGSDVQFWQ